MGEHGAKGKANKRIEDEDRFDEVGGVCEEATMVS
jgi:hypothetical protein